MDLSNRTKLVRTRSVHYNRRFCLVCTTFITFEYALRLVSSPHRWLTFISLRNIFDLFVLIANSMYFLLIPTNDQRDFVFDIKLFQYLMLVRLFRFFRLCHYVKSLRILYNGIEKAFQHIMSIGFIILFFVFTFGVIIQVIEKNWDRAHVTRLEDLFNIVTISTITVGDAKRVPLSPTGKFICSFLAGIGLISISLPLPSIYRTFQSVYRIENMERRFIVIKYIYPDGKLVRNQ